MTAEEFDKSKIYEDLAYEVAPAGYQSKIPWVVQQQIAATNGKHYVDLIGKLDQYPEYELPVDAVNGKKLMLDIGCGWGRWLVAGAKKGYVPIGIDLRLDFCKTSQHVLKDFSKAGYTVVADLQHLPFKQNVFDLVWSFSVIQHVHKVRMLSCLQNIYRILATNGYTYLEFPNKLGLRNRFGPVAAERSQAEDMNSWCVRYYSPEEYKEFFLRYFQQFEFYNHSLLGIGILKEDLEYVSIGNKMIVALSLFGSSLTKVIPNLKNYSDSIFVKAEKKVDDSGAEYVNDFLANHQNIPGNNLNIIPLLCCPATQQPLLLDDSKSRLINVRDQLFYPIIDSIPILIKSEAQSL